MKSKSSQLSKHSSQKPNKKVGVKRGGKSPIDDEEYILINQRKVEELKA